MARKHSKHGGWQDLQPDAEEAPAEVPACWLCARPTGETIVWHHPVPKSRGGREVVPMHPIYQKTLITQFTNSELQRHGTRCRGAARRSGGAQICRLGGEKGPRLQRHDCQEAALSIGGERPALCG